jgi:threonine dehydratase
MPARFGVRTTICVPVGNNPTRMRRMRALGATLIEEGRDYDESVQVALQIMERDGATLAHSTNDRTVLAGAATLSLEMFEQAEAQHTPLDAVVAVVGGGSQAVGAMTVARALSPHTRVYAVQAAGAAAAHDSWHAGQRLTVDHADTFADGLATRSTYDLTYPALRDGLAGFVTVTDTEIAEALRLLLRTTHPLVGGRRRARGLNLAPQLAGQSVGDHRERATSRRDAAAHPARAVPSVAEL